MTKANKLLTRLLSKPKDFTWAELVKVLSDFGYKEVSTGKTAGSRARFTHNSLPPITLHKPHPKPILKRYQLEQVIELLKQEKVL
ncbi:MAG: type II toxin-antitoxin system HicA family toxin [Gammaproteobacteria bacterium]